jgi:hypothetical protein
MLPTGNFRILFLECLEYVICGWRLPIVSSEEQLQGGDVCRSQRGRNGGDGGLPAIPWLRRFLGLCGTAEKFSDATPRINPTQSHQMCKQLARWQLRGLEGFSRCLDHFFVGHDLAVLVKLRFGRMTENRNSVNGNVNLR